MAKAVLLVVLVPVLSLLPLSSLALNQDFCVANLNISDTPAGYPCKAQTAVTADDFKFSGLATAGPLIPPFLTGLRTAFVTDFAGLNGLGLGASRVEILPHGVVPLHTHPEGSELLFVQEGTIAVGFISAQTNTVYATTVKKGELFVFPQGLLHYQYNAGATTAVGIAVYSSSNPGLQIVDFALFKNNLPTDVVRKVTFLGNQEIKRLKALFGGSG